MSTNILTPLDHILIQHIQSGDFERAVVTLRQVTTQSVLDKLAEGISPETAKNLAIFGGIGVEIDNSGTLSEFVLGEDEDRRGSGTKRISFGDGSFKSIDARDKSRGIAELLGIIHTAIGGVFQKAVSNNS